MNRIPASGLLGRAASFQHRTHHRSGMSGKIDVFKAKKQMYFVEMEDELLIVDLFFILDTQFSHTPTRKIAKWALDAAHSTMRPTINQMAWLILMFSQRLKIIIIIQNVWPTKNGHLWAILRNEWWPENTKKKITTRIKIKRKEKKRKEHDYTDVFYAHNLWHLFTCLWFLCFFIGI